jgi:ribose-phosphate pyrophosphokinase
MDDFTTTFISPLEYEEIARKQDSGPNGWLLFVACNSGLELGQKVKEEYEKRLRKKGSDFEIPLNDEPLTKVFDDTETRPRLPFSVAGANAFVFQYVNRRDNHAKVNDNFMELCQVIRTLKVHGAQKITAVMPYHAYARQDKPTFRMREATTAKLIADLLITSGVDDILAYHLHTDSVKGFYEPHHVVSLTGLDLFLTIFERFKGMDDAIAVSTDAGSSKFTLHLKDRMGISYAISSKYRPKDQMADTLGIIGNIKGKKIAVIADDETVTCDSLVNVMRTLSLDYGIKEIYAAVSHNKMTNEAIACMKKAYDQYNLKELHVTDSVPQTKEVNTLPFIIVHSLADRLACTINRMHYNQSVSEVWYRLE